MTVKNLANILECKFAAGTEAAAKEVSAGYCGDLLSWVMSNAHGDCAWVTVIGNVNAIAVAVLNDIPCVILAQGAQLDADARKRADQNGVAVLLSEKSAYELAVGIHEALR